MQIGDAFREFVAPDETPENRMKRLRMRSWRRGTKEMDLILGPFADAAVGTFDDPEREAFERLLGENDQDLYLWVCGRAAVPSAHADAVARIRRFHSL